MAERHLGKVGGDHALIGCPCTTTENNHSLAEDSKCAQCSPNSYLQFRQLYLTSSTYAGLDLLAGASGLRRALGTLAKGAEKYRASSISAKPKRQPPPAAKQPAPLMLLAFFRRGYNTPIADKLMNMLTRLRLPEIFRARSLDNNVSWRKLMHQGPHHSTIE